MSELLKLTWQVQLSLAVGYLAYLVAYTGIREGHKATDTTFWALAFGVMALGALTALDRFGPFASVPVALAAPILAAIAWRKWVRHWMGWTGRMLDISWSNDDPSALQTVMGSTKYDVSQISVLRDDGRWLECRETALFKDYPHGPCVIGPNGDVAMYVTHYEARDGADVSGESLYDEDLGWQLTYIPASRVRQMEIRLKEKNKDYFFLIGV